MSRRRWSLARACGLALLVVLLSPVSPLVLVGIPLAVFLLAYQHRNYVALALAAAILLAAFGTLPARPSPLWYAERAWALMLGGGFVLAGLFLRSSGVMVRSLAAVAIAMAAVAFSAALRPALLSEIDWWVESQLGRAAQAATGLLGEGGQGWTGLGAAVRDIVEVQVLLYPALLGLASLAALALGWFVVSRLTGSAEGLAPLREFRFGDQLVWVFIAGLLLFLLPAGEVAGRLGENVLVFMGGLYLLRGIAVLVWLAAALVTSAWAAALWTAVALLFYPVVVGAALLMGLTDTWLDLRGRFRRATDDAG